MNAYHQNVGDDAGEMEMCHLKVGADAGEVEVGHGTVGADSGKIEVCHQRVIILLALLISSGHFNGSFRRSE